MSLGYYIVTNLIFEFIFLIQMFSPALIQRRHYKALHRFIRSILRFIIRHKKINRVFSKWKWFNHLCYEEAQAVIGNRPWK